MTIGEVIDALRRAKPTAEVRYGFGHCVPTKVNSWRGVYAEPALGWAASGYSGDGRPPTADDLLSELERAISGIEYSGWKGGEYAYSRGDTLHIDNRGDCSHTELDSVKIEDYGDGYVTLCTRYEP